MKNNNLIEIKTINDFVNKVTRENLNEVVENMRSWFELNINLKENGVIPKYESLLILLDGKYDVYVVDDTQQKK